MSELCLVTGGAGVIGSPLGGGAAAAGQRGRRLGDPSTRAEEKLAPRPPAPGTVGGGFAGAGAGGGAGGGGEGPFPPRGPAPRGPAVSKPRRRHIPLAPPGRFTSLTPPAVRASDVLSTRPVRRLTAGRRIRPASARTCR